MQFKCLSYVPTLLAEAEESDSCSFRLRCHLTDLSEEPHEAVLKISVDSASRCREWLAKFEEAVAETKHRWTGGFSPSVIGHQLLITNSGSFFSLPLSPLSSLLSPITVKLESKPAGSVRRPWLQGSAAERCGSTMYFFGGSTLTRFRKCIWTLDLTGTASKSQAEN